MLVNLSKHQLKTILFALYLAAEWEDSMVDANTINLPFTNVKWCDPAAVRKFKANIKNFNDLRTLLRNYFTK